MALHRTSGRTQLGVVFAVTCMIAWATLPVALSLALKSLDPITLTWFRFVVSTGLVALVLQHRRALPELHGLGAKGWALLAVGTLGLVLNYLGFLLGLELTTPGNVQVLSQLSPLVLAAGGIAIFGERPGRMQLIGFAVLTGGLGVFFADQLRAMAEQASRYLVGTAVLVGASLTWSIYGLAQKQLLSIFSSQGIMVCLYAGCALCLTPLAQPHELVGLSAHAWALLLYCALNTVVAYGCFSASLEHLEASRVGAVISLTPVATFAFIGATEALWPGRLATEHWSATTIVGALVVVLGSVLASLGASESR